MSAETLVNTYNLFIDSSTGRDALSQGDNYQLHLGHAGIVCEAGQYIRLTLNNFTMNKNFTDINANNSDFTIRLNDDASNGTVSLTHMNHTTLNSLTNDFATNLGNAITNLMCPTNTFTVQNPAPSSTAAFGGDSDHIIEFDLSFASVHTVTNGVIQCYDQVGDAYQILGGDRIFDATDTTTASIDFSVTNNTTIHVKGFYPAQRHSTSFVYLRALGIPNTSIETVGFANDPKNHRTDTTDSDILARIPVSVEFCNYDAQSGREYFMNVRQKQISHMSFRLTDAKNRPLGRPSHSPLKTAAGTGQKQSTAGNLNFSAVIRVDIIQQRHIKELETPPLQHKTPARFETLQAQPKFGRDAYGSGVGK